MAESYKLTKKGNIEVSYHLTIYQDAMKVDKNKLEELVNLIYSNLNCDSENLNIMSAVGIIFLEGKPWHSFEAFGNFDIVITGFEEVIKIPIRNSEVSSLIVQRINDNCIAFFTTTYN